MQVTLDSAILEHLLDRAATASRLLGQIDDRPIATLIEPAEDSIDEIVHVLSELLGRPDVAVALVTRACLPCAVGVAAQGDVAQVVASAALAVEVEPVSASAVGGAR